MGPLDIVHLSALMQRTHGRREVRIGLIDGPVFMAHPDIASENIKEIPNKLRGTCSHPQSAACLHGTLVAGILVAKRGSLAPAICPDCTLLVRSIFSEAGQVNGDSPIATPHELAEAIIDCVDSGARVLNLSVARARPYFKERGKLELALDYAAARGAILVAAAGNHGVLENSRNHSTLGGHSCCRMRRPRNSPGSFESGKLNRPARSDGSRRGHRQSRG